MKKFVAFALTLILVLTMLSGCNQPAPKVEEPAKVAKDTITLVTDVEPDTLDPRRGNSVANNIPMRLIHDSLMFMGDDNVFQPRLATKWEFIDDTHIRFTLREGVKFSNGDPFTSADVLYSLARTKLDSTSLSTMKWYDEVNSKAEGPLSVVLAMNYPYAPALQVLCGGRTWIGSQKVMEAMGEEAYARNPVGLGPYMLDKWTTGASMELKRNTNFWGEPAKTEKLVFKYSGEATARVIAMETGEVDFAYYINGSDIKRVNEIPGYHVERGPSAKYYTIVLNMQNPKFADERVRYALSYAIDLEALVDAGFDGTANVMSSIIPSTVEGWKDTYGKWEYNPEKAKALLAEAGATDLSFELHILPTAEFQKLAEIVQSFWAKVGVTVNIEQSALAAREAQGPWEASIRNGNATEITGILIIYDSLFASRVGNNDDKLDEMLMQLQVTYDKAEREKQIHALQDYIYKIRFTIPFAETDTIYGVGDHIEGYEFTYQISNCNIPEWVAYKK